METYLFAYGFLQSRFQKSALINPPIINATFVEEGRIHGCLYLIANYPGVVLDETCPGWVHGEILLLHEPSVLTMLDEYEHASPLVTHDPDYHRILRPIETKKGIFDCWIYTFARPTDGLPIIPDGRFNTTF